jgi:hypothetical protein
MKVPTGKRARVATLVALTSMLLTAPTAQARLDEGGRAGMPEPQAARAGDGDGFSWSAAGIGAGATAGVLMIAGGAGLVMRKRYLPAPS